MTFNPYADLPAWLSEGLAMYAEGGLEAEYRALIKRAIAEKSLISVPSLSSPFSARAEESYLAYAQSYSLVEFLITSYGQGKMLGLLNTFSEGSSYDGALEKVYGFDMKGLDTLWREKVTIPARPSEVKATVPVQLSAEKGMSRPLVGTLAAPATAPLLISSLVTESRAWRRGW